MKDKKGMIAESMSEIGVAALIVVIAVVILGFASGLNKTGKMESSQDEMLNAVFENSVALYFKQPVELSNFPDQQMTMADLIVLAAEDKNLYGKTWRENTVSFLPTLTSSAKITRLKITINDDKDLSVEKKFEVKEDDNSLAGPLAHKTEKKLKEWTAYLPGHEKPVKIFIESYGLRIDFYYK